MAGDELEIGFLEALRSRQRMEKASLWWRVVDLEQQEQGLAIGWGCAGWELRVTWAEVTVAT